MFWPGIGYAIIALVNLVVLIGSLFFGVAGLFSVHDKYTPLLGILYGIPAITGTLLFGTIPAVVYYINYNHQWPGTLQKLLLRMGLASFLSVTIFVILCIFVF